MSKMWQPKMINVKILCQLQKTVQISSVCMNRYWRSVLLLCYLGFVGLASLSFTHIDTTHKPYSDTGTHSYTHTHSHVYKHSRKVLILLSAEGDLFCQC